MIDFFKELENNTKKPEEIEDGIYTKKDLAEKIKGDFSKKNVKEIAKKTQTSAENMPDKIQVQNLSKSKLQDLDEIE